MVWHLPSSIRGWALWPAPRLPAPSKTLCQVTGPRRRRQRVVTGAVKPGQEAGRGRGSSGGSRSRSSSSESGRRARRSADAAAALGFGQAVRQGQQQRQQEQEERSDSGPERERGSGSSREGGRQTPGAGSSLSSDIEEGEEDWEEALAELSDSEVSLLLREDMVPPIGKGRAPG